MKTKHLPSNSFRIVLLALIVSMSTISYSQQKPDSSGYAAINGISMYYEVYGKGEIPLVLIHGGGSTIQSSFAKMIPLLSPHHKLIAMELQAHGRTSDRNTPESFEQDADDVAALLAYLHVKKADVLGFSNGATTTLQLGIRHAALVRKLIVVAGCTRRDGLMPGFFEGMDQASLDNMPAPLKEAFLAVNPDPKNLQLMFDRDKTRMQHFKDIPDQSIHGIKAAVLFMVADKDVVTVAHTQHLSKLVQGSELVVLPGLHGEMLGEACNNTAGSKLPEATTLLIEDFLKK